MCTSKQFYLKIDSSHIWLYPITSHPHLRSRLLSYLWVPRKFPKYLEHVSPPSKSLPSFGKEKVGFWVLPLHRPYRAIFFPKEIPKKPKQFLGIQGLNTKKYIWLEDWNLGISGCFSVEHRTTSSSTAPLVDRWMHSGEKNKLHTVQETTNCGVLTTVV